MRVVNTFDARDALGALRAALERSARALEADLRRYEAGDGEEGAEIRQAISALLAHEQNMLERVRRAEQRLRDGVYGNCTRCGRPLEEWQLRAVPEAELCTSCHQGTDD
jgi:RNA polymerase-binding transcription factor DksA